MSNFSSAPFDQPEAGDRAGGGEAVQDLLKAL